MTGKYDVRVDTNPVANQYSIGGERIVEFSFGDSQDKLCGGLISFRIDGRGKVRVELYRLDDDVEVVVRGQTL